MKKLIFLFILLFPVISNAGSFFDEKQLFRIAYGNPLNSDSSIAFHTIAEEGDFVRYLGASLGRDIVVYTEFKGDWVWQIGLYGFTNVTLGHRVWEFPLLTQDFSFGIPFTVATRKAAFRFEYGHISAHLGDGANDAPPKQRIDVVNHVYSRDFFMLRMSFGNLLDSSSVSFDVNGRYGRCFNIVPDYMGKDFIGISAEVRRMDQDFNFYMSHDLSFEGDVDALQYSIQMGAILMDKSYNLYETRLGVTYYFGRDIRGMLRNEYEKKMIVGLYVR